MKLRIILNDNIREPDFEDLLYDCKRSGGDPDGLEIKTWDVIWFTNNNGEQECGLIHCDAQFEKNSCITLSNGDSSVRAIFRRRKKVETKTEQESIILFHFAAMLRNHFLAYISSISLLCI